MSLMQADQSLKPPSPKQSTWPEYLLDGGEMAELICQMDWSTTPLGPIESWPKSLRTLVKMVVSSSFPLLIDWGPEKIQIYNDAFIPIAGHNHPKMLGRPCREIWFEIWDSIINPIFVKVCETQKSVYVDDQHLPLMRFGFVEEVYCLVAYSPLPDDDGQLGGVLLTVTETTGRVLGERRLKTLRNLGAHTSEARSVQEACRLSAETFEQCGADIPFALIYLTDQTGDVVHLAASAGIQPHEPASPEIIELSSDLSKVENRETWPLQKMNSLASQRVDDVQERFGKLTGGPWPEAPRTALILPIASQTPERPIGFLICGISPRLQLDEQYGEFLNLVNGQVASAIGNAQVYEQERQRAEALAELDRAKTEFFSNISHEFRTPLTLMLGPLEEMLNHPDQISAPTLDQVKIIYRNGLRLLRLVNSLLDFSRIEADRVQATYQATDLSTYTADLASVFRSAIEKGGLTFTVDCPPLPEPIYIDREMWEKIVLNLLSNAFKFTFTGGITVKLSMTEQAAILSVQDTGTGIAADELPKIFERFHQVKDTRSRSHEGAGIGLALVHELVKLHGGTLTVESALGQGTQFSVAIPRGTAHLPADKISHKPEEQAREKMKTTSGASAFVDEMLYWLPEERAHSGNGGPQQHLDSQQTGDTRALSPDQTQKKQRIVLADDNADMLTYVERLLLPFYDVIAVTNGEAALAAVEEHQPDLVLTDVMMPVLDGFGLLRRLREEPKTSTLPIIMLSARAGEEASIEGLEAGADDYLVKPFSAQELLARVRSNLEMARIRQEAEAAMFQAQKMQVIGQLTGGVAHDFNSLLTVLMGNLSLLEPHVREEDENGRRMLKSVFKAVERINSLTQQLLAFARKQPLQTEQANLNQLILTMDELFNRTLDGMIHIQRDLSEDLWPTEVDVNQIQLAILNLAINARDAMPEGGTLSLATQNLSVSESTDDLAPGDYVLLTITDTGTGMSPEVVSKAFEPFFTTKDIGKGTGLGLSQVYGLAKQLGGTARIKSTPGKGTRIEILLPRKHPSNP